MRQHGDLRKALRKAGIAYSDAARGKRPEVHGLGPPRIDLGEVLLFHLTTLSLGGRVDSCASRLDSTLDMREPPASARQLKYLRHRQTYDRQWFRITFCWGEVADQHALENLLLELEGAVALLGAAPMGRLEEEVGWFLSGC